MRPKLALPNGWFKAGSRPDHYDMGVDPDVSHAGSRCASIQSLSLGIPGFGTLMQMCKAKAFVGQRIRFTAHVRTEDVSNWAGLWLRIDGHAPNNVLGFDNMGDRPLRATCDWRECAIVLDVPRHSRLLAYGVLLSGSGRLWISDVRMHLAESETPPTGDAGRRLPDAPVNLDFAE